MSSITKINDFKYFTTLLGNSTNIVVLTGRELSEECGVHPLSRAAPGYWRGHKTLHLASLGAFRRNPTLVWEYFNDRRKAAFTAEPSKAHVALAKLEGEWLADPEKKFNIITQNVDGLHTKAGSSNVIELHGALNKVRCMNSRCKAVTENNDHPICEALRDRVDPEAGQPCIEIPVTELPKCPTCQTLVRPHIVWFGECLSGDVLNQSRQLIQACDLCLVIGTSMSVYPASEFAPMVADAGKAVAEFNISPHPSRENFLFHFPGPSSVTLPKALGYEELL